MQIYETNVRLVLSMFRKWPELASQWLYLESRKILLRHCVVQWATAQFHELFPVLRLKLWQQNGVNSNIKQSPDRYGLFRLVAFQWNCNNKQQHLAQSLAFTKNSFMTKIRSKFFSKIILYADTFTLLMSNYRFSRSADNDVLTNSRSRLVQIIKNGC